MHSGPHPHSELHSLRPVTLDRQSCQGLEKERTVYDVHDWVVRAEDFVVEPPVRAVGKVLAVRPLAPAGTAARRLDLALQARALALVGRGAAVAHAATPWGLRRHDAVCVDDAVSGGGAS